MLQWWPMIVFGWPAVIVTLLLSVAGIVRKKPALLVIATIVVIPISYYLMGSPRFGLVGLAIPLCLLGSSIAVHRRYMALAWLLLVPFAGVMGQLALMVLRQ
jgi:hypothetical protein